jgi:predicted unusual protein kinase regulating ubiquinone biosynthesis (AarF/ABC1/UbiB family)
MVQYAIPIEYTKQSAKKDILKLVEESGSVWQKFAQTITQHMAGSGYGDLYDELESLYSSCPRHPIEYSQSVLRDELSDMFNEESIESMEYIASGTVAQTYRVKLAIPLKSHSHVCVKIIHPTSRTEINDACDVYDFVKDSYFFPARFVNISKMFFESLREQCDTSVEFHNGKNLYELCDSLALYHKASRKSLIVSAEMFQYTDRCIVMEYIPSESLTKNNLEDMLLRYDEKHIAQFLRLASPVLPIMMTYHMKMHLDLHIGNIGFRVTNGIVQLVVYDAGQFIILDSISELERDIIRDVAISVATDDLFTYFKLGVKPEYFHIYEKLVRPGRLTLVEYRDMMQVGVVEFLSHPDHAKYDSFIFVALLQFKCIGITQLRNRIYDKKLCGPQIFRHTTMFGNDIINDLFDPSEYNMESWFSIFGDGD